MKRTFSRTLPMVVVSVIFACVFAGCGPTEQPEPTPTPTTEAPKIVITRNIAKVPVSGGTAEFAIEYNTSYTVDIESSALSWIHFVETRAMQSGTLVFQVDANKGEARTGKATVKDNEGKLNPLTLTFEQEAWIPVSSITLDQESAELEIGQALTLTATVSPDNATDKTVIWTSSDADIATVDDGKVTAIAPGETTITACAGDKEATCSITVKPGEEDRIKAALMKIYDAMDGPNWKIPDDSGKGKWDVSKPLNKWFGVEWNNGELKLTFNGAFGLKGELPDCFGELTSLVRFWIQGEPGVVGTLPPSFAKLDHLGLLTLAGTSMTSLPDIFGNMPLWYVDVYDNPFMTGPVPESLGLSDALLGDDVVDGVRSPHLSIGGNSFSGSIPQSWFRLGIHLLIQNHRFSGQIPDYFYTADNPGYIINLYINEGYNDDGYRKTDPFVVKDRDIPGYWPDKEIKDIITGKTIDYKGIVSKNRATVIFKWATWCGYSKALMPLMKRMYEKYHDDGLEIIARTVWGDDSVYEQQKEYLLENGYDCWHNFSSEDLSFEEACALGEHGTPFANVVDSDGNIIYSTNSDVSDPLRGRFGHVPFIDLIPFLEDIFGPMEDGEVYSSSDYSHDGEAVMLQEATVGKGINIVFMGDAYTDKDIAEGLYDGLMWQSMEEFFSIEPYKTFRDRFNVYYVRVVSKNGKTGAGYTTALGFHADGSSISTSDAAENKSYEYALKVPGIKDRKNLLIGVLVNSSGRRGITGMHESSQSGVAAYASGSNLREVFGPLIRHEAGGHGFAFLADEYSNQDGAPSQEMINEYNRRYNQYGWYSNVDFTSDPKRVKWNAFLSDERYKDEVGVFEGGANFTDGVYRPSNDSMMNHTVEYYNAPSRWAIYKRIMELSGEEASFEKFLEYDAINRK